MEYHNIVLHPNSLFLPSAAKPSKKSQHSINTFMGTGFPCLIQSKNIMSAQA